MARPPSHFLRHIILSAGRGASVNMRCQPELGPRRFHCSGDNTRNIHTKRLHLRSSGRSSSSEKSQIENCQWKALKQAIYMHIYIFRWYIYIPCRTGATIARLYFCKPLPETGSSLALFYFLVVLNTSPYVGVGTANPCSERMNRSQQGGCMKKEKVLNIFKDPVSIYILVVFWDCSTLWLIIPKQPIELSVLRAEVGLWQQ